jgi:hypothetical protein
LAQDVERFFSVELHSKADLKNMTLSNGSSDGFLVEGSLGILLKAVFIEDTLLEVTCEKGILRINLKASELKTMEVKTVGSS